MILGRIKIEEYLSKQLNGFRIHLNNQSSDNSNIAEYILNKLLRKKYRKKSIGEESKKDIYERIQNSIFQNAPIHLIIPFGWYKHFWNKRNQPDWAEFFHIINMVSYLHSILETYTPWVIIEYVSEDLILPAMNWYKVEDLNHYTDRFRSLMGFMDSYLPTNLQVKYTRLSDVCNASEVIEKVYEHMNTKIARRNSLDKAEKIVNLHRSVRSVIWFDGDVWSLNLDDTSDPVIKSRLLELSFYDIEADEICIGDYYMSDNKIMLLFSFGVTPDNIFDGLTIWSLYNSIVDFRIWKWIVEYNGTDFIPRILSRKQYEGLDKLKINIFESWISLEGFENIEVFGGKLFI